MSVSPSIHPPAYLYISLSVCVTVCNTSIIDFGLSGYFGETEVVDRPHMHVVYKKAG
jgi:hypothetical protein